MRRLAVPLLLVALVAACTRGADEEPAPRRAAAGAGPGGEPAPFDFGRPLAALALDPDDVARRLGSFEWTAGIEWTFVRQGDDAQRVRAVERHRVRQAATGDFDVSAEVDPGLGPGSDAGKDVIWAGGVTYARARYAPWRVRPTDRGRDARLFRDESFSAPAALLRLCGAVTATPAGEVTALGRAARRWRLSLDASATAPPAAAPARPAGAPEPDEDTRRRLAFLEGRVPTSLDGELVLDATGAPLRVRLAAAFGVRGEPKVRATVELAAQVKGLGGEVPAILPPKAPLPDERKPAGVANALDAAGLRKRVEEKPARAEPVDDADERE
ncbi:MAG TPA: hypothetical protein VFL83_22930 [Anaeromyxobacter sp.]|nr:hypothetical protein [Anaeromyxobacter sp.]